MLSYRSTNYLYHCKINVYVGRVAKLLISCKVLEKKTVIFSMNRFKYFIEWHVFGVCTAIGEKMGIATTTIRKYFIYISFLTMGSPFIIYLFVAFWMNVKSYIFNARRNPLRYL